MLPTTNASRGKVPALPLVSKGLWLRLLAINLASIKPQPLQPQSKRLQTLLCLSWDPLFLRMKIIWKGSQSRKGMKDYIPSFLEEALGGDCNLQIKMAHTMQAQEKHDRKCFICQSVDHLMKDHYKGKMGQGPYSRRGLPKTSWLVRWPRPLRLVEQCLREPLQSEGHTLPKS